MNVFIALKGTQFLNFIYWCDLFVWCPNDHHLETINLIRDVWNAVKDKVDMFYFSHFLYWAVLQLWTKTEQGDL